MTTPSAKHLSLPFDEAIDFFRQKVSMPTARWNDLWRGMHARGFMIAGAMQEDLLADMRGAVDKAIAKGTTLAEFKKDFDAVVGKHGWSYQGGRNWRARVIYQTNVSTAYHAGRHKQMTSPAVLKVRPWWRYLASSSSEKRTEHLGWVNTVLPHDDPWWQTHRPPNGWGCKCGVTSLSARQVEKLTAEMADTDHPVRRTAPAVDTYEWTDKVTGKTHQVPVGIDPGWDYNVGEAAWGRNEALRLMDDTGPWRNLGSRGPADYGRPAKIAVDTALAKPSAPAAKTREAVTEAMHRAIGGDGAFFTDPAGGTIRITDAVVDHIFEKPETRLDGRENYFPLIPELIENPFEIWAGFARSELSGRVAIRRKYVKAVRLDKNRILGMWAETMNGHWVAGDFFRGAVSGAKRLRQGHMIYGR